MDGKDSVLALQKLSRDGEEETSGAQNEADELYSHYSAHCGGSGVSLLLCE